MKIKDELYPIFCEECGDLIGYFTDGKFVGCCRVCGEIEKC